MNELVNITINGVERRFVLGDAEGLVPPTETLLDTIRGRLGLTGAKKACDQGGCGCCAVILDGDAVASCMVLTADCGGRVVTTIEGLEDPLTGELDPVQQAFVDRTAFQCGYCTPGIIIACKAVLDKIESPTEDEIREALSGNFCRCISHYQVMEAVRLRLERKEAARHA